MTLIPSVDRWLFLTIGALALILIVSITTQAHATHPCGEEGRDKTIADLKKYGVNLDNVRIDENGQVVGMKIDFSNASSAAPHPCSGSHNVTGVITFHD